MANDQSRSPDQREAEIRDQVRGMLERSGAYAGLAAERRQTLTAGVERMLLILAAGASAAVIFHRSSPNSLTASSRPSSTPLSSTYKARLAVGRRAECQLALRDSSPRDIVRRELSSFGKRPAHETE